MQRKLHHNECPLKNAHDPLTSHTMTSSPRAPPPPLTLTGATLGTKQAQRKLNHPLVWTVMSQTGAGDSIKPHSFEWGDHRHSAELLIYTKWVHHTAEELGFCWQWHYRSCTAPLLVEHCMSAPCVRHRGKTVPLWFKQRDGITQPNLLKIDTFMSLPHGILNRSYFLLMGLN